MLDAIKGNPAMTASLIQANRGQPQNMQPNNIPFMNTNMMPNQMMQRTRTSKLKIMNIFLKSLFNHF